MKKNDTMKPFIIVSGIMILIIFTVILGINVATKLEEDSNEGTGLETSAKYVTFESAKVEKMDVKDNKLYITTSGDAKKFCAKSTKSTPEDNNICWKDIDDNESSISVYKNKKYYVWIKDSDNNISNPVSINT